MIFDLIASKLQLRLIEINLNHVNDEFLKVQHPIQFHNQSRNIHGKLYFVINTFHSKGLRDAYL